MGKGDHRRPGRVIIDCEKGHAMLDQRGRCIRCGDQVGEDLIAGERRFRQALAEDVVRVSRRPGHTAFAIDQLAYIPGKHGPHVPSPRPKGQRDFA